MSNLNAIIVCVDFADLLAITLPYNRRHFDKVRVVTTADDEATRAVARDNGALVHLTGAFYRDGADFNKWLALEEGLEALGREGWLCILDADVLLPKTARMTPGGQDSLDLSGPGITEGCSVRLRPGHLCSPLRRMCPEIPASAPAEDTWWQYPVHRNIAEWAGYCQIFHASDPVLGPAPWHETDWRHAGGADSFFQAKWPLSRKMRPPFDALHLGPAGENWCGRVTRRVDGSEPEGAAAKAEKLRAYMAGRRVMRLTGGKTFDHEKLPKS